MLPGPTIIRECPHCNSPFKEWTMASGNTFRAKWWSDGKMVASMMPNQYSLVSCPSCNKPVWIEEAKLLDKLKPVGCFSDSKVQQEDENPVGAIENQLKYSKTATLAVYEEALADLKSDAEKERYIRVRIWWLGNDIRRNSGVATPLTDQEVQNLESLMPLLDGAKQNDILAKAEALRELGRFDECIALIDAPEARTKSDGYAANILYWAEQCDPYVRQIQDVPWDFVRSGWKKLKKQQPPFEIDPSGPPVFKIDSDRWWVKVLGMLQHNWALIEEQPEDGSAVVYFAHDEAPTRGCLRNRWAIIDSLEFDCRVSAMLALKLNGFCPVEEASESIYLSAPEGLPYDARATSRKIYSEEDYWKELK